MITKEAVFKFNIDTTNINKGFALILLLWHHLFYEYPEYGFLVYKSALLAKVCVAIFVLLSGYGLSESFKKKPMGIWRFYFTRLKKLYITYWIIALIFIPIGVFYFDRTLEKIYGNYEHIKLLIQMLGLHMYLPVGYGYNPTWWFMSLIIGLYLLFPFLYKIIVKFGIIILFILLLLIVLPINAPILSFLKVWLLPFAIGIYLSQKNGFEILINYFNKLGNLKFFVGLTLILLISIERSYGPIAGTKIDWLFAFVIIVFISSLALNSKLLSTVLRFLGKHSYNIFLFHTFIYHYYWKEFIYSFQFPILIFIVLINISLIISILIDKIKQPIYRMLG